MPACWNSCTSSTPALGASATSPPKAAASPASVTALRGGGMASSAGPAGPGAGGREIIIDGRADASCASRSAAERRDSSRRPGKLAGTSKGVPPTGATRATRTPSGLPASS